MGDIVKQRERVVKFLCGKKGIRCTGLSRFRGPKCPCVPKELTIKDIQIAHISPDGKRGRIVWKDVLQNPQKYLPLCVVCNYRMRDLKEELRKHNKETRRKAAEYTSQHGGIAAAKKFYVDHSTVLRWRQEFFLPKFIKRKYPPCAVYNSHSFNTKDVCSGCGYRRETNG